MSEDDFKVYIVSLIGRPLTIDEMVELKKNIDDLIENNQYA